MPPLFVFCFIAGSGVNPQYEEDPNLLRHFVLRGGAGRLASEVQDFTVTTKAIQRLLPQNKDDIEAARALVALGYPAVEPVLVQMLEWLKSNGSPVALVMQEFFVSLGIQAVPEEIEELLGG